MYSIYIFIHDIDVTDFEKPVLESNKVVVIINEKHWGVFLSISIFISISPTGLTGR